MVWFFERGMEMAVLEVRRSDTQFEFSLRRAGGGEQIEVIPTPAALIDRMGQVPDTLFNDGWRPVSIAQIN